MSNASNLKAPEVFRHGHRFVPDYSAQAALLTDKTSPKYRSRLKCTEEAVTAFRDIQQALGNDPVLHCPNFANPFILQTDASDLCLDRVLLRGPRENRHPFVFIRIKN